LRLGVFTFSGLKITRKVQEFLKFLEKFKQCKSAFKKSQIVLKFANENALFRKVYLNNVLITAFCTFFAHRKTEKLLI